MSITLSSPPAAESPRAATSAAAPDPTPRPGSHRDRAIDLVRFGCLVVVVVLHSMMSGAQLGPEGTVLPTVALSGTVGFTVASWFFQVMPLFFFIGGYAALNGWRRTQAKGGDWGDYLRSRLRRLVVPVTVLIALAGLGLSVASEFGVSPELLAEASTRIGQPLWFLAVYVGLTSLVPLAAHFHARAPRLTIAVLAGAVIAVDGLVALTGVSGLGYLNFLFVWPLIQQCGFFFADAVNRPVRTGAAWTVMVFALLGLGGLVALGVYSPNMLVNLNPPTGALVLLGLAQMSALRLGHAWLNGLVEGGESGSDGAIELRARAWDRVISWGNSYGIHVYLWHMPVVIVLIGGLGSVANLLSGVPLWEGANLGDVVLPAIESPLWWASRLPWLIVVMALSALLAVGMSKVPFLGEEKLGRLGSAVEREVRGMRGTNAEADLRGSVAEADGNSGAGTDAFADSDAGTATGPRRAAAAVGLAMAGIAIALLIGIAPLIWTIVSVALLMASLVLAAGLKRSPLSPARVSSVQHG